MTISSKSLAAIAVAVASLAGVVYAQTASSTANAVGRAASAAVTPGDQNMGRTPNNRSGGLMGDGTAAGSAANSVGRAASAAVTPGDQNMGRTPNNRSGGLMGADNNGTGANTTGPTSMGAQRNRRADRN